MQHQHQDTYYNILFTAASSCEVFAKLESLLDTLPSPSRTQLASQIAKILPRYNPLHFSAVPVYLTLTGKVLEHLMPEDAFGLCFHAFTAFQPAPGCPHFAPQFFAFLSMHAEHVTEYQFFAQTLPKATAKQLHQALICEFSAGRDATCSVKALRPGFECVVQFILGGIEFSGLFKDEEMEKLWGTAEWLGHLTMLSETAKFLCGNPDIGKFLHEQLGTYMSRVLPYVEKGYQLDQKGLHFAWTDFVVASVVATFPPDEALTQILAQEYFGRFPERSENGSLLQRLSAKETPKISATKMPAPDDERAGLSATEEDDEELRNLFVQLQERSLAENSAVPGSCQESLSLTEELDKELQHNPELMRSLSSIHVVQSHKEKPGRETGCYYYNHNRLGKTTIGKDKSQPMTGARSRDAKTADAAGGMAVINADDPSTFTIDCTPGTVKPLSQLDKVFIAGPFNRFVEKYIETQDALMHGVSETFHKHFKHQYISLVR